MQKVQVQSLGWKYPLEEEMTTQSSILTWEIPWTEKSGELQSMGSQRIRHDLARDLQFFTFQSSQTNPGKKKKERKKCGCQGLEEGEMESCCLMPAQVEGTQGFLPQPGKALERPSSTRLKARFPTMTREQ